MRWKFPQTKSFIQSPKDLFEAKHRPWYLGADICKLCYTCLFSKGDFTVAGCQCRSNHTEFWGKAAVNPWRPGNLHVETAAPLWAAQPFVLGDTQKQQRTERKGNHWEITGFLSTLFRKSCKKSFFLFSINYWFCKTLPCCTINFAKQL